MTEPLEKYNMPPAYIYRLETSPRMISQFGLFTSFQANVDANGNNILGDAANEPSITVDPTNHNRMAIGWRQFNSVQSDFRQGGWAFTTDAGTTWTFPGVLEDNVFRSDPVLGSDEAGNFFYLSLLQFFCDNMYGSLDFGQTWTRLQPDGDAGGGDKQWFTIDKTGGPGHGFQYQAWSTAAACNFSGQFSRSTDGGVTWMSPISIPSAPVWGTLDVDTNGNLFIGGGDFGSEFFCVRSSNAQNGQVTPTFDQNVSVNLGGSVLFAATINPGGLAGMIFLVVDRSGSVEFGRPVLKSERAVEVAAVLALAGARQNDRVGALVFSDEIDHVVRPAKGRHHALRVIRDLLTFKAVGKGTNIEGALRYERHGQIFLPAVHTTPHVTLTYSQFLSDVSAHRVKTVTRLKK